MDVHVFVEQEEVSEHLAWPGAEVAVYSRRSPAKTTANEDGALVAYLAPESLVLAVADGVGGHAAGEEASRRTLQALRTSLAEVGEGNQVREAVLAGIDRANASVLELGSGAATTIVAVVIEDGHVRAYHVGDSQALAFGGRGKLKLETIPHSPVGFGVEAGLLAAEDALSHEDRHIVSNVVGDADMHIGLSARVPLCPRDSVVVASDGLFDNIPVAKVTEMLRRGPLDAAVDRLVEACATRMTDGGHPDDLTLVAFRPSRVQAPAADRSLGKAT